MMINKGGEMTEVEIMVVLVIVLWYLASWLYILLPYFIWKRIRKRELSEREERYRLIHEITIPPKKKKKR